MEAKKNCLNRLISQLLVLCFTILLVPKNTFAQKTLATLPKELDFDKLNADRGVVYYDLNEIIKIIEDSIELKGEVITPPHASEFEKALFLARRIQHNDSQFTAIRILKYLLEFEYYRTPGEKQYLRLLLGTSLDYIGAPLVSNDYLQGVFPELFDYLESNYHKRFFLNHYAGLLMKIESRDSARKVYKKVLDLSIKDNDSTFILNTRNNYGYVLQLLGMYDSAKYYFRLNQHPAFKKIGPIIYAFSFGNYASTLKDQGEMDSIIYYANKELIAMKKIASIEGLENTHLMIGEYFEELGNVDSAKLYYKKSLEYCRKNNNLDGLLRGYEHLIPLCAKEQGDIDFQSVVAEYYTYNDSLKKINLINSNQDESRISRFLQIFLDAGRSKKEFDELEANNRELYYLVIGLLTLLILLVFWALVRQRYRKKLEKTNNELTEKNRDLEESYQTISETNLKNETLLKELHHRVKNNLQMIISLFNLQLDAHELDSKSAEMFRIAQDRVFSIALIHKKIYQSEQFAKLNFRKYLEAFINELVVRDEENIDVDIQIEDFDLSLDSAVPLGLIINELFTNSLKHAKPKHNLQIKIRQTKSDEFCEFIYMDNGQGISLKELNNRNRKTMGLMLIELLANQLEANIEFKTAEEGSFGFWFCLKGNFK